MSDYDDMAELMRRRVEQIKTPTSRLAVPFYPCGMPHPERPGIYCHARAHGGATHFAYEANDDAEDPLEDLLCWKDC